MSLKYRKIFKIIWNVVEEAGAVLASQKGQQPYTRKSSEIDLVTPSDKDIEDILLCGLSKNFPEHKFISEEQAVNEPLTNEPTWLIDPVDGTMNFIHGYPHSCISIALLVDKVIEIGIVYNPHLNQKFTAMRGKGAFCNDSKMCVSGEKEINKSILMMELCSRNEEKIEKNLGNFAMFSGKVHGIRCIGSPALNLSMVASGGADAYFDFGSHHWDVAAGAILVREAGGVVLDPVGSHYDLMARRILVASSNELACSLAEHLLQVFPKPKDK